MARHGKKNNTEVKIYVDRTSRSPFVVAVKLHDGDWWRPLCQFEYEPDAIRYFNELLA